MSHPDGKSLSCQQQFSHLGIENNEPEVPNCLKYVYVCIYNYFPSISTSPQKKIHAHGL